MSKLRTFVKSFAAATLGALLASAALAQPAAQKSCAERRAKMADATPYRVATSLAAASCLGGALDADAFTRRVNRLFETAARVEGQPLRMAIRDVTLSEQENRALVLAVLRVAEDYLGTVQGAASGSDAADAGRMRASLQLALRDRSDGVQQGIQSPAQVTAFWTWDAGQPDSGVAGIDIRAMLIRSGCDAAPRSAACAVTQSTVEGLLRGAHLVVRAFTPLQAAAIQAAAARAATRDARWRSYFADARSQYPWELYVNSLVYESRVRSNLGISGPPNWQWIVLHPDAGMQYVRSAAAGDRFKPALVLELLGYNRWSWGGDHKPHNAWGASLVRTYADTVSVPSGAWGVAVHYNNKYTLTLSRHDGKTGILLSADLLGALTSISQAWVDRFRIGD